MTKPAVSFRRIDQLRAIAFNRGFTNEDARQFGKLSKTATWEALLELHLIDGESLDTPLDIALDTVDTTPKPLDLQAVDSVDTIDWTNDGSFPVCFTRQNSTNFLDWVDFGQLLALVLASAGVFVLAMSMWQQINPLNLFPPIRINIQIGAK
ncbi:MAG: hypothetical protein JGK17_07715 [Microcoleus sp. PH2017_10_PVI_O_A]|uniref:hypothetical protein n=1 Tax=unclassified Microcoleus TaxID=2642155 RepID=UPI001DE7A242|nr:MULTISPECIES: hypothetical protein [unclassified Microcoleus]TAE84350.1 MAG: hypothetical protein EAZ83_06600 [Oscillatoriales cyanobacterium]MCC3405469.1 hypothetical protein [Microcoleus sp. PH2017_10_PVI_O_A]MCC3461674.1 hypothetical protein [Microcoleus sp. PH2017_11_PCY_U_A]MCC3477571.1 hypothetical protein [Microcoleus sp. PH2017_12_PCY_D_A]MCC3532072.1 hypothetical protein [Microcoleus sp. PH2017_21_RUC_O_A]